MAPSSQPRFASTYAFVAQNEKRKDQAVTEKIQKIHKERDELLKYANLRAYRDWRVLSHILITLSIYVARIEHQVESIVRAFRASDTAARS